MKISIITPTLNRIELLKKNISSTLMQTYCNWEQLIVDGGSYDGTCEYIKSLNDGRIKLVTGDRSGIYSAINSGINSASGELVAILNDDDFYVSENLFELIISNLHNYDGVYGDICYINISGKTIRYWVSGRYSKLQVLLGWMPPHPSVFLRKSIYDQYGVYNTAYKISADYEFFLRLMSSNVCLSYLNKIFVNMTEGGASNGSPSKALRRLVEDYSIIMKYDLYGMITLLSKILRKIKQIRF